MDNEGVLEICNIVVPNNRFKTKTFRVGKKRNSHSRPLCVIFENKDDALSIIRNNKRYTGPIKMRQDLTVKQQYHLNKLRDELKAATDSGIKDKTIRYSNGILRIVELKQVRDKKLVLAF